MYYRGISLTLCRIIVKNMPVHTVQQIEIANKVQLMIFTLYDLLLSPVLYYLLFTDDINLDEQEEKARLISQVMELQNTLDGNVDITNTGITSLTIYRGGCRSFAACRQRERRESEAQVRKSGIGAVY